MPTSTYDPISTTVLANSSTTSVTISSITQSYTHLRIVYKVRMALGSTDSLGMRFNGVSSSSYAYTQLASNNGAGMSTGGAYTTNIYVGEIPGSSSDGISNGFIDLFDYSGNQPKGGLSRLGDFQRFNSSQYARNFSWNFFTSSAITSVTFYTYGNGAFLQDSSFALYGIARE